MIKLPCLDPVYDSLLRTSKHDITISTRAGLMSDPSESWMPFGKPPLPCGREVEMERHWDCRLHIVGIFYGTLDTFPILLGTTMTCIKSSPLA